MVSDASAFRAQGGGARQVRQVPVESQGYGKAQVALSRLALPAIHPCVLRLGCYLFVRFARWRVSCVRLRARLGSSGGVATGRKLVDIRCPAPSARNG
eukprot:5288933-Prymnesium_polylepis.1